MNRITAILNFIGIFILVALFVVLNCVAYRYSNHITQYLCGFGIDYDSEEYQQKKAEAEELAKEIAGEGIVMLKNENDALPLTNPCLNVFGWGGCDNGYIYMGFGSGTASTYGQISLYEGLRTAGFELNENLCSAYNNVKYERDEGWAASSWKLYEPLDILTEDVLNEAVAFSDTALVVFSRFGMEGYDLPKYQNDKNGTNTNNGRSYLELTEDEETLLGTVTSRFDKVIVIINSANSMELGFLDNENIDAALDIYFPGNSGSVALGRVLTGEVTPSGHLVDTLAYDHTTAASYANSSTNGTHQYTGYDAKYVDYAEDIYTGYYWYETADAEGFWESAYAREKWQVNGYEEVVQYPFGYGLSYADFEWTLEEISLPTGSSINADSEITLTVSVLNKSSSSFSGQDVVQLYMSAPYTKGGIEKPSIKLVAFAKTSVLDPGKSEKLTLSVALRDIASYDCYDANNNGFMGYEAEAGEYTLSLRTDVHTLADVKDLGGDESNTFVYDLAEGAKYATDEKTGNEVGNLFTTYTNPVSGASSVNTEESLSADSYAYSIDGSDSGQNITYMTRENFAETFPEASVQRTASKDFIDKTYQQNTPLVREDDVAPATASDETSWTINDMYITDESGKVTGLVPYNDKKWDELISQLTVDKLGDICGNGGLHTIEISEIGKPACKDSDGPSGFNTTIFGSDKYGGYAASYPCEIMIASTWNWKMAYLMGCSVGGEAEAAKIDGWYGPACNLHRTPYGGRNYEYYSEDAYLSGVMCAYTVLGAKEEGLYAYVKHFAANETETTRAGGYTWMTEQALRENYLKPFEAAVKDGGTLGIMSAYNRIGSTRTSGSYNLLTELLREEWGFEGCVVSDYNNGEPILCPDEAIRAGNDLMMEVSGSKSMFRDRTSATAIASLHRGAKNVVYCYVAAQYSMATSSGLDLTTLVSTQVSSDVFPWWIILLVVIDVIAAAGAAFWCVMVIRSLRKKRAARS